MLVPDNIEVIQFTDEYFRNCVDYGFFGKKTDWNPEDKILLYPIENYSELKKEIELLSAPNFYGEGESTFLRDPNNEKLFLPSKKYKDNIIANKDSAIVEILEHLGITEFYGSTHVKVESHFGGNREKSLNVKGGADGYGSVEVNKSSSEKGGIGIRGRYDNSRFMTFDDSRYELTEDSWSKACEIAKHYGLDKEKDINKLLIARKPSVSNSKTVVTADVLRFSLGADINANLNIAKGLSVLAKMPGVGNLDCGLSKLLNFDMELSVEYETVFAYNFSSEPQIRMLLEKENIPILS